MGSKPDGSDSLAVQIAPASHWPEMRALILVVSADKKDVSSTSGMQITVDTSQLLLRRAETVVPVHMEGMKKAILQKDFESFGKIAMMDSNSFHATCLDTYPPIFYINDVSRAAIRLVEEINGRAGKIIAAYTFDAGPNAVIYFEEGNMGVVAGLVKGILGEVEGWQGKNVEAMDAEGLDERTVKMLKEGVGRIILTVVGEGPVRTEESLVDEEGEPIKK